MLKPAKTERWSRCAAMAILVGLSTFILSAAILSIPFYNHYSREFPADNQNMLSAMTSSVLVGLGIGGIALVATIGIYLLFGLVRRGSEA